MDFHEHQQQLAERIRRGELRLVYLDPDGTAGNWMAVVIQWPTGIVYGTQCDGVATDQRMVEGYLVPLGGARFNVDEGPLLSKLFRDVFHNATGCFYSWDTGLPKDRLARLSDLVRDVPYWPHRSMDDCSRERLELDVSRLEELCEAWIPVLSPEGPGVLLFDNCD